MKWYERFVAAVNKIHGGTGVTGLDSTSSEADVIAFLEAQTPIEAGNVESSEDVQGLQAKLKELSINSNAPALDSNAIQAMVTATIQSTLFGADGSLQNEAITAAITSAVTSQVGSLSTQLTEMKTSLAEEINSLKLTSSSTSTATPPATLKSDANPPVKEDETSMTISMADVFKGEIVSGLGSIV